jgi:hypothetical protein
MLAFFIMFLVVGFLLGFIFNDKPSTAITIIVITSIVWAFIWGAWAIATLFELLLGYAVAKKVFVRIQYE